MVLYRKSCVKKKQMDNETLAYYTNDFSYDAFTIYTDGFYVSGKNLVSKNYIYL